MPTVELKVKIGNRAWEDIPVAREVVVDTAIQAGRVAKELANNTGVEVRWNFAGQGDGHYIQPRVWPWEKK